MENPAAAMRIPSANPHTPPERHRRARTHEGEIRTGAPFFCNLCIAFSLFIFIFAPIELKTQTIMQTVFNQAQLDLLDMMSFVKSPHMLSELMQVISDYFAKQADEEIDRLWEDGTLSEDKVESFRHLHERTPYQ